MAWGRQAIIWTNDGPGYQHKYASLGLDVQMRISYETRSMNNQSSKQKVQKTFCCLLTWLVAFYGHVITNEKVWHWYAPKGNCHFHVISIVGCTGICQNDNFRCSQQRKFRQSDISVSVLGWWLGANSFLNREYLPIVNKTLTVGPFTYIC